ncbi:MAG: hypothetical protein CMB80_17785 [Flammeovirgaceae bacterium]|nr:hypothetical protein [Flammeovirgaceae bacterium]MBR10895.1 hypothetical protein [Rickettsiales bacterium]HCX22501.1 hypothetical protein [Cytophagales bacterium]|tara:strand:- start:5372 stop:5998 length:627 start_codon:yes stop_codon:yes gene_type:complete
MISFTSKLLGQKFILLLVLSLLIPTLCYSQVPQEERRGAVDLHAYADYLNINTLGQHYSGGLIGEYHFSDKISSFYPIGLGDGYFELGLGTFFAPLGLLALHFEDEEEQTLGQYIGMMLALATSVESMGYHLKIGQGKEIIPYYSLCKLRSVDEQGYLSGSLGAMLRLHLSDRWHLNWSGEYSLWYTKKGVSCLEAGLSFAYAFGVNK